MRLPYALVRRSWLPVFFGKLFSYGTFHAQTIAIWICVPGDTIERRVLEHEQRHVWHFYVAWVIALALWLVLTPGWWWLLVTPLAYLVAYTLAGFYAMARGGSWYHDNPFERDARRHAGEPV